MTYGRGCGRRRQDDAASAVGAKKECLPPNAVMGFMENGEMKANVLNADAEWFGMTCKEDRESAAKRISRLLESG